MSSFVSNMTLVFQSLVDWVSAFLNIVVNNPVLMCVIALFVLKKITDVFKAIVH